MYYILVITLTTPLLNLITVLSYELQLDKRSMALPASEVSYLAA